MKTCKDHVFKEYSQSRIGIVPSVQRLDYGLEISVRYLEGAKKGLFFTTASRPALSTNQPPVKLVPGVFSPIVKWPGCESDHSPPSHDELKNEWSCTALPTTSLWPGAWLSRYVFVTCYLVKHRGDFILTLFADYKLSHIVLLVCRSQWPHGLRHVLSSAARTLGSWVRIPLEAWMCVRIFLCCVVLCR
jgi:hypothetical protein